MGGSPTTAPANELKGISQYETRLQSHPVHPFAGGSRTARCHFMGAAPGLQRTGVLGHADAQIANID
jgi:hypothetical protein